MSDFALVRRANLTLQGQLAVGGSLAFSDGVPTATRFTLSGLASGTTGQAATFTVTPDGRLAATATVTPAASNAGTVNPAILTFASGTTAAQTFTVTRTSDGTSSVSVGASALAVFGSPINYTTTTPSAFGWTFADLDQVTFARNTTTVLATGVPAGAIAYPSPDLLPGVAASIVGTEWRAVGDATVPTVSDAAPGSVLEIISARDIRLEVLESAEEHAQAQNMRTGVMYGRGAAGGRQNIQVAMIEAQDGDTIQISPGFVWRDSNDGSGYLDGCMFAIYKSVTVTNYPGRGRWYFAPKSLAFQDGRNGITIWEPSQCYSNSGDTLRANPRKTIVVEGFEMFNWGRTAADNGIRIRSDGGPTSWASYHQSITFRNFKIGKPPYLESASGFNGSAENLVFEDGHVYDCGGGRGTTPGQDHNFYISGRNLTMRGVRSERTRANSADGSVLMDGHHLKLLFNNMDIQGCAFYTGDDGDSSHALQVRGGGNLVFRGNLVRCGPRVNTARGAIAFVSAYSPAEGWFVGAEGHSLLVEKNVFVNHRAYNPPSDVRGAVYFAPSNGFGSGEYLDVNLITSCVIRDNIAMSTTAAADLVRNPPPVYSGPWNTANAVETYTRTEDCFLNDERALRLYRRRYGTLAASGTVATHRFLWPHGSTPRSDAFQGLG